MANQINEIQRVSQPSFNFFDPEQFKTMQRVCTLFANSELVPEMYRVTPKNTIEKAIANCMVAIEMAQRIDASPLMVMQNLIIIYGRPSWSSKFLIATVNSCGRFEPIQYRFSDLGQIKDVEYIEYEWNGKAKVPVAKKFTGPIQNVQCIAYTNKKGSKEILESVPVTIEMAIKEGWYTKSGSKWKTMQKLMLTYRAASFWTSAYAPELSMGIKTTEEAIDIQDISHVEIHQNDPIPNSSPMDFDDKKTPEVKTPEVKTPENKEPAPIEPLKKATDSTDPIQVGNLFGHASKSNGTVVATPDF